MSAVKFETNPKGVSTQPPPPVHPGGVFGVVDTRGAGVYTIRAYAQGEIVLAGQAEAEFPRDRNPLTRSLIDQIALRGGLMSRVAHSCEPNCGLRLNGASTHDLVARDDIPMGAEVTCDYATRSFLIDLFPDDCRCHAAGCRGIVTGWGDLPPELKLAYRDMVAPHLLELDGVGPDPCNLGER